MKKNNIIALFDILRKANPNPVSELEYKNNFQLLVAVVLSAQATDVSVNKATPALFKAAPTPKAMVILGEDGIREFIRTIGLFNNKAKSIFALSQILLEKHDSEVPDNRVDLEKLPGVGHKTASVVLNVAFGKPTLAVDTHVMRVSNRLGLAKERDPKKLEAKLVKVIPTPYLQHAHHWLILHGRYVCTARSTKCEICSIAQFCEFNQNST
ncbi:MAG: endonuclease III [Magnetococcales bacterium]|nr:endonuclease III [Magnetococcales bacterium]